METSSSQSIEQNAYSMDRYSRQIGAYGIEAMSKLVKMRVLVVGLNGVGAETAKNLALAGPAAITLMDTKMVEMRDLGSNFYLRENDVGKITRAAACVPHLKALNRLVEIDVHEKELTEEYVSTFTAMICCDMKRNDAIHWNEICRKLSIGFFYANIYGVFGFCFVDLGDHFQVRDRNGEQPISRIIDKFDRLSDTETVVHLIPAPDGKRHNIEDSEHEGWIEFDEVEGEFGKYLKEHGPFRARHVNKEIKDSKTGKIRSIYDAYALAITSATGSVFPPYSGGGGTILQVKQIDVIKFRSLEQNIIQPITPGDFQLTFTDGTKFGRGELLHCILQGIWEYESEHPDRKLPCAGDDAEVEEIVKIVKKRNDALAKEKTAPEEALTLEVLDEDVVRICAKYASCHFQPLACFFGGVIAQEAVKMTGKYSPMMQWLHLDCVEVLPELYCENGSDTLPHPSERKPIGSRYDDLIVLFGKPFQEKLLKMSTFMVGCGALGCELLKNFAMLGISCDPNGAGTITVTDNDKIEVSNLSRQFLFREHNVGQPKSVAASVAAIEMNPHIKVKALEHLVSPQTEKIFDDIFWENQDFVTNALDNIKARVYVDSQCVFYQKPLLESGTLGTKCNVQIVVPFKTQSYSDGPKDNEDGDSIPMCTLRNFPSQIEHCIEWSRARFNDWFTTPATEASQFLKTPDVWIREMKAKTLEIPQKNRLRSAVETELPPLRDMIQVLRQSMSPDNSFFSCVSQAYTLFHRMYRDKIVDLITTYPHDAMDKSGHLFWSGTKRFPQAAEFDANDETHIQFIISTANLLAVNYGLQPAHEPVPGDHPWRSTEYVKSLVATLKPPEQVHTTVDMSGGEEETTEASQTMEVDDDHAIREFEQLLQELGEMASHASKVVVEAADFEKDADWNFHIDFITACSNMRAWNYRMKHVTRHKCKMIAGKIIPALATTTASVTGLVMIEMLKVLQSGKKLEAFRDASCNLGINGFFFSEPSEPVKAKDEYDPIEMTEVVCKPQGFTKWDQTRIDVGSVTLGQFMEALKVQTGLTCTNLSHNSANHEDAQGKGKFIYEKDPWPRTMADTYQQRLQSNLEQLVFEVYGEAAITPAKKRVQLHVSMEDDEGNIFKIPDVVYIFKH